jgi:two-component system LytT family response regulator
MRVLIVDDEPLARSRLARLCDEQCDLEVVGEAESGAAAIGAIQALHPDVVLLDVELEDMTGFDVLHSCDVHEGPLAIMVTAHPEHAAKAFATDAIDYLTKPVDLERFDAAIERARSRRSNALLAGVLQDVTSEVRATLGARARAQNAPRQLVGEKSRRIYFVDAASVDYIEAGGNYVMIHADQERYISRDSLKHLAESLTAIGFLRISRSLLVNLRRVAFAERIGRGVYAFTTRGGRRLVSSAAHRKEILVEVRQGRLASLRESH